MTARTWFARATLTAVAPLLLLALLPSSPLGVSRWCRGFALDSVDRSEGRASMPILRGEAMFDFGRMPEMSKGTHDWRVTNCSQDAQCLWGDSTCSCTLPDMPSLSDLSAGKSALAIGRGESKAIRVAWRAGEVGDAEISFTQRVFLHSLGSKVDPALTLTIKGVIYPAISVVPQGRVLQFGKVDNRSGHTREITLYANDFDGMKLGRVVSSDPASVSGAWAVLTPEERRSFPGAAAHANVYRLSVTVRKGAPIGSMNEIVAVGTNHPKIPELRFVTAAQVEGPVAVAPPRVESFNVDPRTGSEVACSIVAEDHRTIAVTVERAPPGLEVFVGTRWERSPTGSRCPMRVKILPGPGGSIIRGEIRLRTNLPSGPTLKLPVNIVRGER